MSKLRQWHSKRVAAASEAVGGDLSNLWQNDVAKDVTTAYTHILESTTGTGMKLSFLNSAAPSLVRSNLQQFSYDLCGAIVNEENGDNLGVTLCPAQALTRGQGHVQEASFTKRLAGSNLNIDRVCSLTSDGHEDPRDERPLMFLGRIMLPMALR